MKSNFTEQQKIMITVGATLLVVGLTWFGVKQQTSVFTFKAPAISESSQLTTITTETFGNVLGEQESIAQPTNPLEGIYVNPFSN